jgi:hypothetical protein
MRSTGPRSSQQPAARATGEAPGLLRLCVRYVSWPSRQPGQSQGRAGVRRQKDGCREGLVVGERGAQLPSLEWGQAATSNSASFGSRLLDRAAARWPTRSGGFRDYERSRPVVGVFMSPRPAGRKHARAKQKQCEIGYVFGRRFAVVSVATIHRMVR